MKSRSRVKVPSKGIVPERSEPATKLKVKKSSAQQVQEYRERERQKSGYDHEKMKEETQQLCTKPTKPTKVPPVLGLFQTTPSLKKNAVWASLNSIIDVMNLDVDKLEHLYLPTDNPSSQHRNNGCAFLAKKFAESNKIEVSPIFTKIGHGKGPIDGIGAPIKNATDDAVVAPESMPDVSVRSASGTH